MSWGTAASTSDLQRLALSAKSRAQRALELADNDYFAVAPITSDLQASSNAVDWTSSLGENQKRFTDSAKVAAELATGQAVAEQNKEYYTALGNFDLYAGLQARADAKKLAGKKNNLASTALKIGGSALSVLNPLAGAAVATAGALV